MDKSMVSPTIMDKLSHKTDNFQEKLSHLRHSSLRNEDLKQTKAKSGTIQILLQEKEQRLQERVMNVGERRYVFERSPRRAVRHSCAHYRIPRYDVTPSLRPPVFSAVPVNEQTRSAISEERHKREVQAKGM